MAPIEIRNLSSIVIEGTKAVLLFFLRKEFTRTKSIKSLKNLKINFHSDVFYTHKKHKN